MYHAIEEFIQTHNNLKPIRYSYSNIKKMTKGFTEKLGEGGYGSVYKGKLKSGHLVAVKMLANSVTIDYNSFPTHLGFSMCVSLFTSLILFLFDFLMAPKRETTTYRAQDKCPTEPSQPTQMEARRKARFDMALFSLVEDYQRYKFYGEVSISPNYNVSSLRNLSDGWGGYP